MSRASDYFVIEPCNTAGGVEIKLKDKNSRFDLKKAEIVFSGLGEVVGGSGGVVLLVKVGVYVLSIYASGRIMVKCQKKINAKSIEKLAHQVLGSLEKNNAIINNAVK